MREVTRRRRSGRRQPDPATTLWGDGSSLPPSRRRRPPPARALLGAGLVALAVGGVAIGNRAATAPPTTRYLVATAGLEPGAQLGPGDLGAVRLDRGAGVRAIPADDADDWVGRTVRQRVGRMELLSPTDLAGRVGTARPGSVQVAVEVPRSRLPLPEVRAGSRVDVLATSADAFAQDGTAVLASEVVVLDVEDRSGTGIGAAEGVTLRLELPDRAVAVDVVDAAVRSELTLVVPAPGTASGGDDRG